MWRWLGECALLVQLISRTVKGALHSNVHFTVRLSTSHARSMVRKDLKLEESKKKFQITDKFLDGVFLGIKEGSEEFIVGTTCSMCGVQKCQKTGS